MENNEEKNAVFEREVRPLVRNLLSNAYFLTGDNDDAKDLLQVTLLKAYRFWEKYEPNTHLEAWLRRIMVNSAINAFKKNAPFRQKFEYGSCEVAYPKAFISSETAEFDDAFPFGYEVAEALKNLPAHSHRIILLREVEGCSYEEIAAHVGCNINTVKTRIHRARKELKKILKTYAAENYGITEAS